MVEREQVRKNHLVEETVEQWKVRSKPPRIGRNPKTLEKHEVSARRVVTFYPSNIWREEISNNSDS